MLRDKISERISNVRNVLAHGSADQNVQDWIRSASVSASDLHAILKARNLEPKSHGYMIKNRGFEAGSELLLIR